MSKSEQLIQRWRGLSPADWAESEYGWILLTGEYIALADWQRAVLDRLKAVQAGRQVKKKPPIRLAA